jgi:hypothetical protein
MDVRVHPYDLSYDEITVHRVTQPLVSYQVIIGHHLQAVKSITQ